MTTEQSKTSSPSFFFGVEADFFFLFYVRFLDVTFCPVSRRGQRRHKEGKSLSMRFAARDVPSYKALGGPLSYRRAGSVKVFHRPLLPKSFQPSGRQATTFFLVGSLYKYSFPSGFCSSTVTLPVGYSTVQFCCCPLFLKSQSIRWPPFRPLFALHFSTKSKIRNGTEPHFVATNPYECHDVLVVLPVITVLFNSTADKLSTKTVPVPSGILSIITVRVIRYQVL